MQKQAWQAVAGDISLSKPFSKKKGKRTCPRARFRPRLLSPASTGTVGGQATVLVSFGVDVLVAGSSMYAVCCSYDV